MNPVESAQQSAAQVVFREVSAATFPRKNPTSAEDADAVLLSLADNQATQPTTATSLKTGLIGAGLSLLFHLWLVVTLTGIVLDPPPPSDSDLIETRFVDKPVVDLLPEVREFELANPDERELEVQKAINAT